MYIQKNFPLNQRVIIRRTTDERLDDKFGTILGKSADCGGIDFYIVLLDEPIDTHLAIQMIETCLDYIIPADVPPLGYAGHTSTNEIARNLH